MPNYEYSAIEGRNVEHEVWFEDAAIEVIENGKRTGPWLFFRMKNGIINGTFIGNHVFY